jgi:hypothetical protein
MLFRELDPFSKDPRFNTLDFLEALGGPDIPEYPDCENPDSEADVIDDTECDDCWCVRFGGSGNVGDDDPSRWLSCWLFNSR